MFTSGSKHISCLSLALAALAIASSSCAKPEPGNAVAGTSLTTGIVGGAIAPSGSSLQKQVARLRIEIRPLMSESSEPQFADCTATFISPHLVLTAAHCLATTNPKSIAITVGEEHAAGSFETAGLTYLVNDGYLSSGQSADYDLALIWSKDPLPASDLVTQLPSARFSLKGPFQAAGYGLTYYPKHEGPQPALDSKVRSVVLGRARANGSNSFVIKIDETGGLSHGDSGGPLFVNESGVLKQIGVASSIASDYDGGDVAYTSTFASLDWIRQTSLTLEKNHSAVFP